MTDTMTAYRYHYISYIAAPLMSKRYSIPTLLKQVFPNMTDTDIEAANKKSRRKILEMCFRENPDTTYTFVIDQFIHSLGEGLREYFSELSVRTLQAQSKEELVGRASHWLAKRKEYMLLLHGTGRLESINNDLDGRYNDLIPPGWKPGDAWPSTIDEKIREYGERIPPPDIEERLLDLLVEYRRRLFMSRCPGRKELAKQLPIKLETEEEINEDVDKRVKDLEEALRRMFEPDEEETGL